MIKKWQRNNKELGGANSLPAKNAKIIWNDKEMIKEYQGNYKEMIYNL